MKKYYFFTLVFVLCFSMLSFGQEVETSRNSKTTINYAPIKGLSVSDISYDKARFNFDNMNTFDREGNPVHIVDQIRFRYRRLGENIWSFKTIAKPIGVDPETGICNSTQAISIMINRLVLDSQYEWRAKLWYCGDSFGTPWVEGPNFTTKVRLE